jgi:probable F420-dependent oxidoreductase
VEQTAVFGADRAEALRAARAWAAGYLELPNYAGNWRRLGFDDDDVRGSDRLLEAAFAWGDAASIARRVREHLEAGADHVCVQLLGERDEDPCLPQLAELAAAVGDR